MGFADAYLLKAGLREALIEPAPHSGLNIIVTIPVYNESGLERCLDSLFLNDSTLHAEVLILINASSEAPPEILEKNRTTLEAAKSWIDAHSHPCIDFHVWLDHSFAKKEAGVGTARKILMDEAVRRFSLLDRPDGIIASMDADALVQPNYLEALVKHFYQDSLRGGLSGGSSTTSLKGGSLARSGPDGCSIRFEHPLSADSSAAFSAGSSTDSSAGSYPEQTFSPSVYVAITQYELHLRYYIQSVKYTGYPNAYHTVGSSFAVRADIYCKEGGMNRRQGGEDFYFIQKVAQRGNFSQCNTTCVFPSPRPSDRVPFGTGPVVSRLSSGEVVLHTYDPRPFGMLKELFEGIGKPDALAGTWPEPLQSFLESQDFKNALEEIHGNSASEPAFRKRFWRWFNMFRIMKFLHYARERGYPDIPVGEAAAELLREIDPENTGIPSVGKNPKKLLLIYRMLDLQ
jgi:hypothetical protein